MSGEAVGRAMLQRAQWAAAAFARYDAASVRRIVEAVAQAAAAHADELARDAVAETGFGVVEHKALKNRACSTGLLAQYAGHDYVSVTVDEASRTVSIPRPAGVVLALTPSTNPVATVFFKVLLCLMTRNAVVVAPHPRAKAVCAKAARLLGEAAEAAGAPDGCIQWVDEPTVDLLGTLMTDERTDVVVATGGTEVVRSAYRSGNPAIGVGPGNVPVLVDATADLPAAAAALVASKAFDNSVLCTNESVLIVEESVADAFARHLATERAVVLDAVARDRVREALFPFGRFDPSYVGQDAVTIAGRAGIRVPPRARVLVAPFDLVVPEEPLAHEKLCPVLGMVRVPTAARGIAVARATLRISGAGHSAAVHSRDPRTIVEFGAAVDVLRVSVNVGASLGGSGVETGLPLSMTIGTGYVGRSSVGENLQPRHLVNHTRLAWPTSGGSMPDAAALLAGGAGVWQRQAGPVPDYPHASNDRPGTPPAPPLTADAAALREEIRRLVVEELRAIVRERR